MQRMLRTAAPVAALLGASAAAARWHRTWGASDEQARERLTGDELVPLADVQTTRAVTIASPPGEVWPWLVQMGQGRAGLYTYEWIENALGAQIHNLDRIEPGLQALQVGDPIRLTPEPYLGRVPGQFYRVKEIRPEQALVMLQELPTSGAASWSFILRPLSGERTRLIVRARTSRPSSLGARLARRVELLLLEPGYFVMERGMLRGIKRRAEGATGAAVSALSGDEGAAGRSSARIEGEIVIERPVEEVFDFVADERNEPRYNPHMVRAEKISPGTIGPGTQFRAELRAFRGTLAMTVEYTGYERPCRLASATRLPAMDIRGGLTFEPVPGGTRMRWSWSLEPRGALRLIVPLLARVGGRQERAVWAGLKQVLEGRAGGQR